MQKMIMVLLLLITGWAEAAIKPANGLWRSTDDPDIGSGLMMVTQGDITLISIYSYTAEGQPRWYLAVGQVDQDGLFSADLQETLAGTYLTADNPPSAGFAPQSRRLDIRFDGSQSARFSINGSDYKAIQPLSFGVPSFQTEHFNLSDGTFYAVPDLTGTWAVGQPNGQHSFTLKLEEIIGEPPGPYLEKTYFSHHGTTVNWMLRCPYQFIPNTLPFSQPFCVLETGDSGLGDMRIQFKDLGTDRMALTPIGDSAEFVGRRVFIDQNIRPNDGYWRPEDDPAVGSGMVMVTQGEVTVILLYSYGQDGQPIWQIASGMFDQDGLLETTLMNTTGGSPIEVDGKQTAEFLPQTQNLTVQLIGSELATFSIDGSEPKHIQVSNFGAALKATEHLQISGVDYKYPVPAGRWLFVDRTNDFMQALNINMGQNPADENEYVAAFEADPSFLDPLSLSFDCVTIFGAVRQPFCRGLFSRQSFEDDIHVRFSSMGYDRISVFLGVSPSDNGQTHAYELIRMD